MIDAFVRHLLARYGRGQKWSNGISKSGTSRTFRFLDREGLSPDETYYALYDLHGADHTPGGCEAARWGTSHRPGCMGRPFHRALPDERCAVRFRLHSHLRQRKPEGRVRNGCAGRCAGDGPARALRKVRDEVEHSGAPHTPIIISEFNAMYLNQVNVEDSAFMGPWLANTIRACDGLTFMMSYWTFSDVFEEQGVIQRPYYGGFGLVAERGIPKAAFRAFELLHSLGNQRIESDAGSEANDALITKNPTARWRSPCGITRARMKRGRTRPFNCG